LKKTDADMIREGLGGRKEAGQIDETQFEEIETISDGEEGEN